MHNWEIRREVKHRKKEGNRIVGLGKRRKRTIKNDIKKENKRSRKKAKNREKDSQRVQKDLQIHPPKEEIAEKGAERRFKEKDHYQGRNNRNNRISKECQRVNHQDQGWR